MMQHLSGLGLESTVRLHPNIGGTDVAADILEMGEAHELVAIPNA